MGIYRVLRALSYEPHARPEAQVSFTMGETFEYPSSQFPTKIDIVELIASEAIEEVTKKTVGGRHGSL